MEVFMKDNFNLMKLKEKELIFELMDEFIKEID